MNVEIESKKNKMWIANKTKRTERFFGKVSKSPFQHFLHETLSFMTCTYFIRCRRWQLVERKRCSLVFEGIVNIRSIESIQQCGKLAAKSQEEHPWRGQTRDRLSWNSLTGSYQFVSLFVAHIYDDNSIIIIMFMELKYSTDIISIPFIRKRCTI